jgi:hypothetical protein
MLAELSADERAIALERFRLLTQIERSLSFNDAQAVSLEIVEALATASSSVRPDCRGYDKQFLKLYDR